MAPTAAVTAGSPTLVDLLVDWSFSPLPLVVVAVLAAAYVTGVRRLAAKGRRWAPARTVSFLAGCAVVTVAVESGLATYDDSSFSVHVVQHLLLSMLGPVLLALGAPVTLALQAGSRRTQRGLLRVLHCPPAKVVTHPLVAWVLFGGSMFALYFSGLYELTLRNSYAHDLMHVHFLVVGMLFFWPIVGLDPSVWRLHHGFRLLYVFVALPFHAFLGIALLSAQEPLFAGHTLSDQRTGAGILWAVGDLLGLAAVAIVFAQWMAHEKRESAREDRYIDAAARTARPPESTGSPGASPAASTTPR